MESCEKHPHELGVALCARCRGSWCAHSLVQVRGPRKAPYCTECAMFVGGARSSANRPDLPRRHSQTRVEAVALIAASPAADILALPLQTSLPEVPYPLPVVVAV